MFSWSRCYLVRHGKRASLALQEEEEAKKEEADWVLDGGG